MGQAAMSEIPITISYEIKGSYWTHDGMITVRLANGRKKTTQLGGMTPESLAKIMLRELADEQLRKRT